MEQADQKRLMQVAQDARKQAYAPYSGYSVGAALLTTTGRIYTGCNIENAAFSPTVCAERTAFFKAVSEGERSFVAIAITGGADGESSSACPPCGVCRQVMSEFCTEAFLVVLGNETHMETFRLSELLPHSFGDAWMRRTGEETL